MAGFSVGPQGHVAHDMAARLDYMTSCVERMPWCFDQSATGFDIEMQAAAVLLAHKLVSIYCWGRGSSVQAIAGEDVCGSFWLACWAGLFIRCQQEADLYGARYRDMNGGVTRKHDAVKAMVAICMTLYHQRHSGLSDDMNELQRLLLCFRF